MENKWKSISICFPSYKKFMTHRSCPLEKTITLLFSIFTPSFQKLQYSDIESSCFWRSLIADSGRRNVSSAYNIAKSFMYKLRCDSDSSDIEFKPSKKDSRSLIYNAKRKEKVASFLLVLHHYYKENNLISSLCTLYMI